MRKWAYLCSSCGLCRHRSAALLNALAAQSGLRAVLEPLNGTILQPGVRFSGLIHIGMAVNSSDVWAWRQLRPNTLFQSFNIYSDSTPAANASRCLAMNVTCTIGPLGTVPARSIACSGLDPRPVRCDTPLPYACSYDFMQSFVYTDGTGLVADTAVGGYIRAVNYGTVDSLGTACRSGALGKIYNGTTFMTYNFRGPSICCVACGAVPAYVGDFPTLHAQEACSLLAQGPSVWAHPVLCVCLQVCQSDQCADQTGPSSLPHPQVCGLGVEPDGEHVRFEARERCLLVHQRGDIRRHLW
jgi:hypothetical protein